MKTLDEVIASCKSDCFDGRDISRLASFIPEARLHEVNIILKNEFVGKHKAIEWTRENILKQLEKDVAFGFQKALDRRGISSELMFCVVLMWNRILEEGLETFDEDNYAMYGLPLFKATATKYGFPNPIGEDTGEERKYIELE
jgi:hypothetical protein